jgi:hypothetical protein
VPDKLLAVADEVIERRILLLWSRLARTVWASIAAASEY